MPPQHASEASDTRLPKNGARTTSARPHLISSEQLISRAEPESGSGLAEIIQPRVSGQRAIRGYPPKPPVAYGRRVIDGEPWLRATAKRALDVIGAIALGTLFSPLILVIVLLLRRQGGTVFYRHRRVGRGGNVFECLKFRSMVPNADRVLRELLEQRPEIKAEWLRDHKLRDDPRVTRLGLFLRRTSLDELPQIWNVLRGEMSLVGPRPIVREELMRYGRSLAVYLSAKPGITGLWQVTGRNNVDYRRRVALDVYYVRKQSLLLDLYILLKTPRVVLGGGGAY